MRVAGRAGVVIGVAMAVVGLLASASVAEAGDAGSSQRRFLDPDFARNGKLRLAPRRGAFTGTDLVKQPDGRLLAVGGFTRSQSRSGYLVARFRHGGARDPSFAGNGRKRIGFRAGPSSAEAVAVDGEGRIVVAGTVDEAIVATRLTSSGSSDDGFGDAGRVELRLPGGSVSAADVLVQPDGRIVIAGTATVPISGGAAESFITYRLLPDGSLDTGFGSGGSVTTAFGVPGEDLAVANAAALGPDGRVTVGGALNNPFGGGGAFALARYLPDGSPDPSFDGDGKLATVVGNEGGVVDMYLDSAGRAITAGTRAIPSGSELRSFFTLIRYLPDGSLDPSFGSGGRVDTSFQKSDGPLATAVTPAPDGTSFVAGQIDAPGGGTQFGLALYEQTGALDGGFGLGGRARTRFSRDPQSSPVAAVIQGRRPVAAGSTGQALVMARYAPVP